MVLILANTTEQASELGVSIHFDLHHSADSDMDASYG